MAYRDYILCCECKEKTIYDGYNAARDELEHRFGSTGSTDIMCPICLGVLRAQYADALEEVRKLRARLAEPERSQTTISTPPPETNWFRCRVCGLDQAHVMGLVCPRTDCPTRVTV